MRDWHADLASTAFVKITAVYGHINENGRFVRNIALNLCSSRRCATLCIFNCGQPWTCLILPEESRDHTIRRFRHRVGKPSKTGAFLQSDRCRTCRGSCPRGVFSGFCLLSGVRDNARLRAKRRFLKYARKIRSKAAFINEEAHDNNALPEFFSPILPQFRCT